MNFIESFKDKTILIPLLQRDYVQGGNEEVISPFLDTLLTEKCDLTYIYGYEEDNCFVPVDGQQRLITLWLLHLYLYALKRQVKDFNVCIKFSSRQYAEDFCNYLHTNLESLLSSESEERIDLLIEDQSWFMNSWLRNASVRNMLFTLKLLQQKVTLDNIESIWNRVVSNSNPNITFAFVQMNEDNGIDDDIYIKMNGRGRLLSPFENLKSFMDQHVENIPSSKSWKEYMDNDWANMFWKNRNMTQKHPEEIDDEQLFLFYNILILYHIRRNSLLEVVQQMKSGNKNLYEELLNFLGADESISDKGIVFSIIDRLNNAEKFPLIWFERLNVMTEDFYEDTFHKLNNLTEHFEELNNMVLYIGGDSWDLTSKTYQIAMCKGSFDRTLPLLYAVLCYEDGATSFSDWMRTLRNLILNTPISKEEMTNILDTIDKFNKLCSEKNIYDVLKGDNVMDVLKSFDTRQVKEEILKSCHNEFYEEMKELENGRFFAGCISILFRLLTAEDKNHDELSVENVKAYTKVLLDIFDGGAGGINEVYNDERFMFRRALMTFPPYNFGMWKSNCWSFCKDINEWREYLKSENDDVTSLRLLMYRVLIPAYKYNKNLSETLCEYVEAISRNYESDIEIDDNDSFRFHFIHHPGVWSCMETLRCKWDDNNNFNIELKKANSNNSDRMELRTYGLFLDYKNDRRYVHDYDGWTLNYWPKANYSRVFFQKNIIHEGTPYVIVIDLYFYKEDPEKVDEKRYCFDLFTRTHHDYTGNKEEYQAFVDEDYKLNCKIFEPIGDYWNLFSKNSEGRLQSIKMYSRSEVIKVLRELMRKICSFTDYVL